VGQPAFVVPRHESQICSVTMGIEQFVHELDDYPSGGAGDLRTPWRGDAGHAPIRGTRRADQCRGAEPPQTSATLTASRESWLNPDARSIVLFIVRVTP
jgi:hypothetical protein